MTSTKGSPSLLEAWQDLAFTLMDAIGDHAICMEDPFCASFRGGLSETTELLKNNPSSSFVLATSNNLSKQIEKYHRDTQDSIDRVIAEAREIIGMLMSVTMDGQTRSHDTETSLAHVQQVIQQTQTLDDLKAVKSELVQVLSEVREKAMATRSRLRPTS